MQHRPMLTQMPPPGQAAPLAPGAANMLKLLQQQGGKLNDAGFAPSDLDLALAQLQQAQQRQQQSNMAAGAGSAANMNQMLAMMQANPALAQALAGQQANAGAANMNGNAVAAAAAALAAQQRMQQAQMALQQQRSNAQAQAAVQAAAQAQAVKNALAAAAGLPNTAAAAAAAAARAAPMAGANGTNAAQLLAIQQAARVLQQQQQQQQQHNAFMAQGLQVIQQLQQQANQAQVNEMARKQAQQMQAQQMLKSLLERNTAAGGVAQPQPSAAGNPAALLKQLQLQEALAKQDALARATAAAQANQAQGNNNGLAELLLRQQQLATAQAMAGKNNGAGANGVPGGSGLSAAQLQQLASTAVGRAVLQNMAANGGNLERAVAQAAAQAQQQQQQAAARGMNGAGYAQMNGNQVNAGAAAGNGMNGSAGNVLEALLAAQAASGMPAGSSLRGSMGSMGSMAGAGNTSATPGPAGTNNHGSNSPDTAANQAANGTAGGAAAANNKEQRRLALACVALQLARSGLSLEQAIESGIMGGMSVVDVRFIQECYNAERSRMLAGGGPSNPAAAAAAAAAAPGMNAAQLQASLMNMRHGAGPSQSTHTSRTQSPAASMAGSHMSMFGLPPGFHLQQQGAAANGDAARLHLTQSMGAPDTGRPSSYGSAGHPAAVVNGVHSDHGSPRSEATRASMDAAKHHSLSHPGNGTLTPGLSNSGAADRNGMASRGSGGAPVGLHAELSGTGQSFNAFNYGFFGAAGENTLGNLLGGGELLGELEPEGAEGGLGADLGSNASGTTMQQATSGLETELAWLRNTANAHRARWEGVEEEQAVETGRPEEDLVARLGNLDLGSGFEECS